ncbi:MAG: polysaccharide biosynthesis tyrosine autokinase [Planctomycetes bacterium]|jgi:capsular exopolysaccharide synthesis family protein|nr:polysaccharide biosynthesis tyrosine autokinase [Planctomycetota bacterium]
MNNLEKYLDQVIEQKPVVYEPPAESPPPPQEPPTVNLLASVRKRWYIALAVTVVICAVALPAIWLLVEPQYLVQGAVKVRPVVPAVLTGGADPGDIGTYSDFVNTQAMLLMNNSNTLHAIADDLAGRNLPFLSGTPQTRIQKLVAPLLPPKRNLSPESLLREAISKRQITASALARTELIAVSMRSYNIDEARTIVDTFLRSYEAKSRVDADQVENQNLMSLERQRDELLKRIMDQRQRIRALAENYGTTVLAPRQEMELGIQTRLLTDLTQLESERIAAEATISLLEKTEKVELSPEQLVSLRREYVNSDPMVTELSKSIVAMERDLITLNSLMPGHPNLAQRQTALEMFKKRLDDKRQELEQEYDSGLERRLKEAAQQRLTAARLQLAQIQTRYDRVREVVDRQDTQTKEVGRTNLEIQDHQFQVQVDQELYDTMCRRIKILEMEQQRPPRVELAYLAERTETYDRRVQLATAAVFGALACGFGLAFLRDKMDKTLQTPEDVTRHLHLPIVGTTTSSHTVKPALFAEQIAGDYQTIRANLGLLHDGGIPRRLVVSSAGTREGKTTFAVNLATSLAKSGKKVLLIDGDLRKPDVEHMLNVPKGSGYLQDVLLGGDSSSLIYVLPSSGLHVLAANPRHTADPYELLTSATAVEQIERLGREYDHVIIDSPPVLAFPDALVWAKLADAVVLVGFAGQTRAPELQEARERFVRGRTRVLGAVLSNVPVDQSLYRHAYTYRGRSPAAGRKARKLLLTSQPPQERGDTA